MSHYHVKDLQYGIGTRDVKIFPDMESALAYLHLKAALYDQQVDERSNMFFTDDGFMFITSCYAIECEDYLPAEDHA